MSTDATALGPPSDAIERACARLIIALAVHTDRGEYDEALALFADDAVMDRDGERFAGIAALRAAYAARPAGRATCHVLSNILVTVRDDDSAQSSAYVSVYRHRTPDGRPPRPPYPLAGPETIGEYRDRFVRTARGWRLVERITRTLFERPPQ